MAGKIGAGHAKAMLRLGLKEMRNAANPSRDSIATTDQGLYGETTPGEIDEAREGKGPKESQNTKDQSAAGPETKDNEQDDNDKSQGIEM